MSAWRLAASTWSYAILMKRIQGNLDECGLWIRLWKHWTGMNQKWGRHVIYNCEIIRNPLLLLHALDAEFLKCLGTSWVSEQFWLWWFRSYWVSRMTVGHQLKKTELWWRLRIFSLPPTSGKRRKILEIMLPINHTSIENYAFGGCKHVSGGWCTGFHKVGSPGLRTFLAVVLCTSENLLPLCFFI